MSSSREIVPVYGRDEQGNRILVEVDQCVRADASLESLAVAQAGLHARRWAR